MTTRGSMSPADRRLDAIAATVRGRLAADAAPEQRVAALNHHLFAELRFAGNTDAYYDPRNSYLNEVLARRTGIPITLSVVYLEVGRRVGLALEGVPFPGHFLVRLGCGAGRCSSTRSRGASRGRRRSFGPGSRGCFPPGSAGRVDLGQLSRAGDARARSSRGCCGI